MSGRVGLLGGRSIVLTGFMGTGKSTVGRILAQRLKLDHVDTDHIITRRHGPIPEIFTQRGEEAFRQIERETAAELGGKTSMVISTGGRLMLDPHNVTALCRSGRVLALTATTEEITRRVMQSRTRRPLLEVEDPAAKVRALLAERRHAYSRFAQVRSGSDPVASVVDAVQAIATQPPVSVTADGRQHLLGAAILPLVFDLTGAMGPLLVLCDDAAAADHVPSLGPVDEVLVCDDSVTPASVCRSARALSPHPRPVNLVAVGSRSVQQMAASAAELSGAKLIRIPTDLSSLLGTGGAEMPPTASTLVELAVLQTQTPQAAEEGGAALLRRLLSTDAKTWDQLSSRGWEGRPDALPGRLGRDQALLAAGLAQRPTRAGDDDEQTPASPTRLQLLAALAARMGRVDEALPGQVRDLAALLGLDTTIGWDEECARLADQAGRPMRFPRVAGGPVTLPDRRTILCSPAPEGPSAPLRS